MKRFFAAVAAATAILFCLPGIVTAESGQRIVTLPSGGPQNVGIERFDAAWGAPVESLTITSLPVKEECAVFLDGKPVIPYQQMSREEAARVKIFVSRQARAASIGFVARSSEQPVEQPYRIRCINPYFSDTL